MNVIKDLDKSKGLDLILHTLGGSVAATEAIIDYLYSIFEDDENLQGIVLSIHHAYLSYFNHKLNTNYLLTKTENIMSL